MPSAEKYTFMDGGRKLSDRRYTINSWRVQPNLQSLSVTSKHVENVTVVSREIATGQAIPHMFLYTWQRIISEMLEKVLPPFVYK
jgi:hypothetical protein